MLESVQMFFSWQTWAQLFFYSFLHIREESKCIFFLLATASSAILIGNMTKVTIASLCWL